MVDIGAILYDFRQQVFNDALWFLEQARKLDKNATPFEYWKNCSWSIIASVVFMESYVTSLVRGIIEEIEPSNLVFLEDYNLGFFKNIEFIDVTYDSKINDDSDTEWKDIVNIVQVRNTIVHFKQITIWEYSTIENAEKGIMACRNFFKKLHDAMGEKLDVQWINKTKSENFDVAR